MRLAVKFLSTTIGRLVLDSDHRLVVLFFYGWLLKVVCTKFHGPVFYADCKGDGGC